MVNKRQSEKFQSAPHIAYMKGEREMAFDYKREYREFYQPPKKPGIVTVPPMNYIAVRGRGDPNAEGGQYKAGIGLLYAVAFTIKMSRLSDHRIDGHFDYVVPPLEGFWRQDGACGIDYARKAELNFISVIRLPDFVTKADLDWALETASRKKGLDLSGVEFFTCDEGLCVQCMHIGPYDDEPSTVDAIHAYAEAHGFTIDLSETRLHHEIYLSDPRKCAPERLRTVIRHPIRTR